jgi:hypothetical protein
MKLRVKKDFNWAHGGSRVVRYRAGDTIEVGEHKDGAVLASVALVEGWAEDAATQKAKVAAPENK